MDGGKKEKIRRIYAWIAVVLFIVLILNITIFQWYLGISIGLYVLIIMYYLFFLRKDKNVTTKEYTQDKPDVKIDDSDAEVNQ